MSGPMLEQVVEWAVQCELQDEFGVSGFAYMDRCLQFAALAYAAGQAAEREACAELCMTFDGTHESDRGHGPEICARSNNKLKEAA